MTKRHREIAIAVVNGRMIFQRSNSRSRSSRFLGKSFSVVNFFERIVPISLMRISFLESDCSGVISAVTGTGEVNAE